MKRIYTVLYEYINICMQIHVQVPVCAQYYGSNVSYVMYTCIAYTLCRSGADLNPRNQQNSMQHYDTEKLSQSSRGTHGGITSFQWGLEPAMSHHYW